MTFILFFVTKPIITQDIDRRGYDPRAQYGLQGMGAPVQLQQGCRKPPRVPRTDPSDQDEGPGQVLRQGAPQVSFLIVKFAREYFSYFTQNVSSLPQLEIFGGHLELRRNMYKRLLCHADRPTDTQAVMRSQKEA